MKRLFSYDDHTAEQQAKQFLNEVDVDNVRLNLNLSVFCNLSDVIFHVVFALFYRVAKSMLKNFRPLTFEASLELTQLKSRRLSMQLILTVMVSWIRMRSKRSVRTWKIFFVSIKVSVLTCFWVLFFAVEGSSANLGSTVRDIITECDKNGDGRISFDEFIAAMKSGTLFHLNQTHDFFYFTRHSLFDWSRHCQERCSCQEIIAREKKALFGCVFSFSFREMFSFFSSVSGILNAFTKEPYNLI
jgi:hypothetical protein